MNYKVLCLSLLLMMASAYTTYSHTDSQERAIAEITRLGGHVERDEAAPGNPIIKVDLHGTKVTDSDLAFLRKLRELRAVDLRLTQIGDVGVANLKNLTRLQTLNLFRTQLTDRGLAHLRKLTQLETLLIGGTKVTDAGLVYLEPLSKLKKLSLFNTQVSDAGIAHLKVLVNLKNLLIGGSRISAYGIKDLQKALPQLSFDEMTRVVPQKNWEQSRISEPTIRKKLKNIYESYEAQRPAVVA